MRVTESGKVNPAGREQTPLAQTRTRRAADHARDDLLDELDVGVLLLANDLTIQYANARWEEWLGAPVAAGTPFSELLSEGVHALERPDELFGEGQSCFTLRLRATASDTPVRVIRCMARTTSRGIVLEARADDEAEQVSMHDIARRLAEVTDMAEVLRTLCDVATRQCDASGAAVLRVLGHQGEVVAAAGALIPARGRCFELEGSLLAEAVTGQEIVHERDFAVSGRPLMRVVPELALGPMIVAPLKAHGETLGVLAVARGVGGAPFRAHDVEHLRRLADHAALAVHKSLLLMLAQSADRAKGRFLATMSHELRTPLTALAGYNELLVDQVMGPLSDPQLDILERMRSVTMHLSAMIEEILAFTSLEEGREVVRTSDFLVADLVRSAVAVVRPLSESKHLQLNVSLPGKPVRMTSDIDKSRQILVNLLGNAVKFTDRGSVSVRAHATESTVRIEIRDTGIGIPGEELSRLFRPFAQVDSGLTRRHGGTGLGLYISRRLATLLHGHVEVESEPDHGSTFTVVLPRSWDKRP